MHLITYSQYVYIKNFLKFYWKKAMCTCALPSTVCLEEKNACCVLLIPFYQQSFETYLIWQFFANSSAYLSSGGCSPATVASHQSTLVRGHNPKRHKHKFNSSWSEVDDGPPTRTYQLSLHNSLVHTQFDH